MDAMQTIHSRRSIKSYLPKPVTRETLLELVDAARYAPSGGNKNPWRFIITTERDVLNRLSETHPYCRWLASASAGIAIVADPAVSKYWLEDSCVAAYAIWLAATARGLGVAWSALYQSDSHAESERRQSYVRELLAIPANLAVPLVLAIGYPDGTPGERKRPTLEEIVHWGRFSSK